MVQHLTAPPLVPSSMSAGGEVHGDLGQSGSGSVPISSPSPGDPGAGPEVLPLPVLPPGAPAPVSTLIGKDGGKSPAAGPAAPSGGWTQGIQPGGLQGAGNPGAGSSGPSRFTWTKTPAAG